MDDPRAQLLDLAKDDEAQRSRLDICDQFAEWLTRVGRLLWVSGFFIGPDRAAGVSPFGDDRGSQNAEKMSFSS